MRVVIVGAGFGKSVHLPTFNSLDGVEVAAIADSGSGNKIAGLPRGVDYCADWRQMIARADVDAVSIAVAPSYHCEIACAALRRGLHVLCEKPFGMSLTEAAAMRRCADDAGVVLGINLQFRYEPGIQALVNALRSGVIGELQRLDFTWLTDGGTRRGEVWSWHHDRAAGGGVIGGFFSHVADLAAWISGKTVKTVYGHAHTRATPRVDATGKRKTVTAEDSVDALLLLSDQVAASVRISNMQPGGDGLVIAAGGDRGRLVFAHKPPFLPEDAALTLYPADGSQRALALAYPGLAAGAAQDTRFLAVRRSVADFVRAVQGEPTAERPTAADAIKLHGVMHALRQSIECGRTVAVNDDKRIYREAGEKG